MKKLAAVLWVLLLISNANAQFYDLKNDQGLLSGGGGITWIDGESYLNLHFNPEIAFGNVGIGLDLNLEFDQDGNLRTENFNTVEDYLAIIRYIRYGKKLDPFYFRIGALEYATLGHGSIMNFYNNSPSFDARKIGMALDLDFNVVGFESVYSNFLNVGIGGMRVYVRPLKFTTLGSIPIIGDMEIGASFVADWHKDAGVFEGEIDPETGKFKATDDRGAVMVYGADIEFPIINTSITNLDLYYDFAKIDGFGNGSSLGLLFDFAVSSLLDIRAKLERRWNTDQYVPAYFNSLYEIERFSFNPVTGEVDNKLKSVSQFVNVDNGYYGGLLVRLLNTFDIIGSYERLDETPNSGVLHLSTSIMPEEAPYIARAGYDKVRIGSETEIFTLDDRSHLWAELGYKPFPYMIVSLMYRWNWTPVRDADKNILFYETQEKVEPRITFVYPFDFGSGQENP
jgi:hypothetical protein